MTLGAAPSRFAPKMILAEWRALWCFSALARHIGEAMPAVRRARSSGGRRSTRLHRRISHDSRGRTVAICAKNDVGGMEGFIGVLGTVGGALRMNAGAHGTQIGSYVRGVNLYPFCAISGGGTVSRANSRAQTANGLAWSDVDHLRRSEGKFSLRQDIRPLARLRGQLAIFADPAGQESFGSYFDPLLKQRGDFFAQIGGVVQTRELEAFERGVGRFVQVMPRWSHPLGSHG
jgi:hypothetical protein